MISLEEALICSGTSEIILSNDQGRIQHQWWGGAQIYWCQNLLNLIQCVDNLDIIYQWRAYTSMELSYKYICSYWYPCSSINLFWREAWTPQPPSPKMTKHKDLCASKRTFWKCSCSKLATGHRSQTHIRVQILTYT